MQLMKLHFKRRSVPASDAQAISYNTLKHPICIHNIFIYEKLFIVGISRFHIMVN